MMLGKVVLGISALVFTAYGVISLLAPGIPAGLAGLDIGNGDAYAEIGAMYGGLQTGLGVYCFFALTRPDLYRPGLLLLGLAIGALAIARLFSVLMGDDVVTGYTYGALAYEFITATAATAALMRD